MQRQLGGSFRWLVWALCVPGPLLAQSAPDPGPSAAWSWLLPSKSPPAAPPKPSANKVPSSTAAANGGAAGSAAAGSGAVGTGPVGSAATNAKPLATHVFRQRSCNIPFTIDYSKSAPEELQLWLSRDRGKNWSFHAKVPASAGHFAFQTAVDGEHWFALRAVEKKSQSPDPRQLKPGLKVIFDTTEPELAFQAQCSQSGEVSATWSATDATLNAETFKVEYQLNPGEPWRTVLVPASPPTGDGSLTGQHRWQAEASGSLLVRAEIADRAGNKSVVSRRLVTRQVAGSGGTSTGPLGTGNPGGANAFHPRTAATTTSPTTSVSHPAQPDGSYWPENNQLPPRKTLPLAGPAAELPPPKPMSAAVPPPSGGSVPQTPASPPSGSYFTSRPLAPEQAVPEMNSAVPLPGGVPLGPTSPSPPVEPGSIGALEELSAASVRSNPSPESASAQPPVELPGGEKARMTSSRQFNLDYEIDSLDPRQVASVELWGTADGGRNWRKWQEDPDHASPLEVAVEQDGIFGFRVVVVASNQLASDRPQPGDPADLWVGVDTTLPTVRLTAAPYGEGDHAGQLEIRWQAFDVWFTDRPITLLFSERPTGPWTTIAAGLPNNGQYYWAVEPRIPRQIFLRIEARDEAGNIAEHQLSEPVSTVGLIPQGRIRGIRPAGSRPSTAGEL